MHSVDFVEYTRQRHLYFYYNATNTDNEKMGVRTIGSNILLVLVFRIVMLNSFPAASKTNYMWALQWKISYQRTCQTSNHRRSCTKLQQNFNVLAYQVNDTELNSFLLFYSCSNCISLDSLCSPFYRFLFTKRNRPFKNGSWAYSITVHLLQKLAATFNLFGTLHPYQAHRFPYFEARFHFEIKLTDYVLSNGSQSRLFTSIQYCKPLLLKWIDILQ